MKKPLRRLSLSIFVTIFSAAFLSNAGTIETESGLKYEDIEIGTGDIAEIGDIAVIHFSEWIDDNGEKGTHFFNSRDEGKPITFKVGTDKVIEGWNIGIIGMRVGGKRRLLVPPELAYGPEGAGDVIPPNAKLIIEINLLEVK
jgi:FKBP-type peptidyl-prolyl cis-trans isomerase